MTTSLPRALAAVVVGALTLGTIAPARAELLPHHEPKELTERAECVVEVELGGEGAPRVVETYVESPHLRPGAGTIHVPALAELDAELDPFLTGDEPPEPTHRRAVLFLDYDREGRRWEPVHTYGGGSQGVWWIEGGDVLRHAQSMNPGPYFLSRWRDGDADRLRELVRAGVRGRSLIAQATSEPRDVRSIACWLEYLALPAPDVRLVARQIGDRHGSVRALTDALASEDDATRLGVLGVLEQLGAEHRGAAAARAGRAIAGRARDSQGPECRAALDALATIAPDQLGVVARGVLLDGALDDAVHAAGLLSRHDADTLVTAVATRLDQALPGELPTEHATALRHLVALLHRHAPDRAASIARRWKDDPRFADHHRNWFSQLAR